MLHGRHDRNSSAIAANRYRINPKRSGSIRQSKWNGLTTRLFVLVCDLVKERIAKAVGVGIPLPRPLVGGQRRRPQRIGAVAAVHRKIKAVVEEQLRPFPPGAELLHP